MSNTNMESIEKISTGYYMIGDDKLKSVENKKYEEVNLDIFEDGVNPYDNARVFLHGSCQLFALALQKKYGYSALNLQIKNNLNSHYFCQSNYKGKNVYIDVRGITTDLNDVIFEFTSGNNDYKIDLYEFADESILSKSDEHGLEFAEQIIEESPEFYDIKKL